MPKGISGAHTYIEQSWENRLREKAFHYLPEYVSIVYEALPLASLFSISSLNRACVELCLIKVPGNRNGDEDADSSYIYSTKMAA